MPIPRDRARQEKEIEEGGKEQNPRADERDVGAGGSTVEEGELYHAAVNWTKAKMGVDTVSALVRRRHRVIRRPSPKLMRILTHLPRSRSSPGPTKQ